MGVIFTPEVLFNIDYDTIFDDPYAEDKEWEEPSEEQKEDEQNELLLRKKLHIRQVRRCGDFTDCSFICSKKNIKRDFILFFKDTVIYGDTKHSDKASYLYVLKHIGHNILFTDMAVETIKAHNRAMLKALHDICDHIISELNLDIDIKDIGIEYMYIANKLINKLKEADNEESEIPKEYKDFIISITYCIDALIYTEDDILII